MAASASGDGETPALSSHDDDGAAPAAALVHGNCSASLSVADGNAADGATYHAGDGPNGASPTAPKLWIRLEESNDPVHDERLLRNLVKLLMNYPGQGAVGLRIVSDGRTVLGDLPDVPINYCPELREELEAMVGAGALELEGDGVAAP